MIGTDDDETRVEALARPALLGGDDPGGGDGLDLDRPDLPHPRFRRRTRHRRRSDRADLPADRFVSRAGHPARRLADRHHAAGGHRCADVGGPDRDVPRRVDARPPGRRRRRHRRLGRRPRLLRPADLGRHPPPVRAASPRIDRRAPDERHGHRQRHRPGAVRLVESTAAATARRCGSAPPSQLLVSSRRWLPVAPAEPLQRVGRGPATPSTIWVPTGIHPSNVPACSTRSTNM